MERIAPGEFCWVELATPDRTAALAFYAGLFGWSAVEQVMGLAGRTFSYSIVRLGDRFVGSVYELLPEQRERGVAPHWLPYVAVASADQIVQKAEELGAACLVDPVDLLQAGRVAVLEDPSGATFAVWEGRNLLGFQVRDEPGSPCWFELVTGDVERAVGFYDALFGWQGRAPEAPLDVVLLARNGQPIAGARRLPAGGDARPRWTTHFAVADCDASRARILGSGGSAEPAQAQRAGRAAAVTDAHGAPFSIVALETRD